MNLNSLQLSRQIIDGTCLSDKLVIKLAHDLAMSRIEEEASNVMVPRFLYESLVDKADRYNKLQEAHSGEPVAEVDNCDEFSLAASILMNKQVSVGDLLYTHTSRRPCNKPDEYFCVYAPKGKE